MNTVRLSTLSLTIAIAVMTLGYANPSFADKPSGGEHDHGGGGADGAMFQVFILGNGLDGGSGDNPWLQSAGGKNAICLNDAAPSGLDVGMLMGLAEFTGEDPDCFPMVNGGHKSLSDFPLHQAIVKQGKKGSAEAWFWFHGATDDGLVEVLYLLKLFGNFVGDDVEFPGDAVLSMDEWELKVENEGRKIKVMSCESEGTGKDVAITVIKLL